MHAVVNVSECPGSYLIGWCPEIQGSSGFFINWMSIMFCPLKWAMCLSFCGGYKNEGS